MADTAVIESDMQEPAEGATMGFLDHLDELRRRLFHSAIFILVAFCICWGFSKSIYNFLAKPLTQVLILSQSRALTSTAKLFDVALLPDNTPVTFVFSNSVAVQATFIPAGTTVPAKASRNDKGQRVFVAAQPFIVGNRVVPEGFVLSTPETSDISLNPNGQLVIHTVQGGFNVYVRVAFYGAIFFSIPYLFYQIWAFIAPGLYKHERAYVWPIIIMTTFFFLLGATFAYYIAFPRACAFLIQEAEDFQKLIEVNEYFDLIITIVLGLGLVFQLPTVVFFLARLGLVTAQFLLKIWRIAILVIFILAAIISPTADIPNMLVFALPMLALYYFSVGLAFFCQRPRQKLPEDEEISA